MLVKENFDIIRNRLLTEELYDGHRPKILLLRIKKSYKELLVPAGRKVCKNHRVEHSEIYNLIC
jgi:hypothetical protein